MGFWALIIRHETRKAVVEADEHFSFYFEIDPDTQDTTVHRNNLATEAE